MVNWVRIKENITRKESNIFSGYEYFTSKGKKTYGEKYISPLNYTLGILEKDNKNQILLKIESTYNTRAGNSGVATSFINVRYNQLRNQWKNDNHIYEIIKANTIRKLYFDLDYEFISDAHNGELIKCLLILLKHVFEMDFSGCLSLSYGEGLKKGVKYGSYHIIVNNGYYFKDAEEIQSIKRIIEKIINMNSQYSILCGGVLDMNVYSNNQAFKIPFQTKVDGVIKQSKLTGYNPDILKSFLVGDYDNEIKDARQFYNVKHVIELYNHLKDKIPKYNLLCRDSKIIKINNDEKTELTEYNNCFDADFKLDIDKINNAFEKDNDKLKYFIRSIPNNNKVGFKVFRIVGYAIKTIEVLENRDDGLLIYWNWAKYYNPTITKDDIGSFYERYKAGGYGYRTIYNLARIFNNNIERFNDINLLFNFKIDRKIKTFKFNKKYIEKGLEENKTTISKIHKNYDIIYLISGLGTGKTHTINTLISGLDNTRIKKKKTILYLSCKRAFASSLTSNFNKHKFTNYLDVENKQNIKDCDRLICSIESLKYCRDKYDIIIFDEWESLRSNMTSNTNLGNDPITNLKMLHNIVKYSSKFYLMDAFLTQTAPQFMKDILGEKMHDKKEVQIMNTYKPEERRGQESLDFATILINKLKQGKKCVLCIGTQSLISDLIRNIQKIPEIKDIKIKAYDKNSKLNASINVNEEWIKYDLLIYTPTITAGISFDIIHFDYLFIQLSNTKSALVRDMIQASRRVRKFKSNTIFISQNGNFVNHNFALMPQSLEGVKRLEENNRMKILKGLSNSSKDNENVSETIQDYDSVKNAPFISYFWNIYLFNTLERNINDIKNADVWKKFLEVENIKECILEDNQSDITLYKEIPALWDDIDTIGGMEYNNIINRIKNKEFVTETEITQFKKYNFLMSFDNKFMNGIEGDFYNAFYSDAEQSIKQKELIKLMKVIMKNDFNLKKTIGNIDADLRKTKWAEIINMKEAKTAYLVKILFHLGIVDSKNNTFKWDKIITNEEINKAYKYSMGSLSYNEINTLLSDGRIKKSKAKPSLDKAKIQQQELKQNITHFNHLLRDSFGFEIKSRRATIKGKQVYAKMLIYHNKERLEDININLLDINPFKIYEKHLKNMVENDKKDKTRGDHLINLVAVRG